MGKFQTPAIDIGGFNQIKMRRKLLVRGGMNLRAYISLMKPVLEEDGSRDLRSWTTSELHDLLATFGVGHKR